ncbi:CatB-related O-acetyltransferase [Candidatus Enterococcus ferrettii]|uniref:CatB-related O-acetyltransferase n=1 Tax=Candidatus Enterococcus ferrettii TaxID=2815324 RepID=A0ABV0ERX2_9ENTE|nr:CatB-related O-acetyltransferase [Enterococcus sp. 665A]
MNNKKRIHRMIFSEELDRLLIEQNIFTKLTTRENRFVIGRDTIFFSSDVKIEPYTTFAYGTHLFSMGAFSYSRSNLPVDTIIGRYSSIAPGVKRMGPNHPLDRFTTSFVTYEDHNIALNTYKKSKQNQFKTFPNLLKSRPIIIGNDVWIGENTTFSSKGITVHDGAVIAANSVVTKDIPPYAIVGGSPAKILKFRFPVNCIHKLIELKWWQYDFGEFSTINGDEKIETFIEKMEELIHYQQIATFIPNVTTAQKLLTGAAKN